MYMVKEHVAIYSMDQVFYINTTLKMARSPTLQGLLKESLSKGIWLPDVWFSANLAPLLLPTHARLYFLGKSTCTFN